MYAVIDLNLLFLPQYSPLCFSSVNLRTVRRQTNRRNGGLKMAWRVMDLRLRWEAGGLKWDRQMEESDGGREEGECWGDRCEGLLGRVEGKEHGEGVSVSHAVPVLELMRLMYGVEYWLTVFKRPPLCVRRFKTLKMKATTKGGYLACFHLHLIAPVVYLNLDRIKRNGAVNINCIACRFFTDLYLPG